MGNCEELTLALEAGLTLAGRLAEYRSFGGSFKWVTARGRDLLQNTAGRLAGLAYLGAKEQWRGCDRLLQDQDASQKGPCKEPGLSSAGGVLLPLLTQKLPGQVPSGVDPGQPLLLDAPSELPLLLSDAEVTQAAAERSGMCVWEGERVSSSRPRHPIMKRV